MQTSAVCSVNHTNPFQVAHGASSGNERGGLELTSDVLAARGLSLESRVGSLGSRAEGLHSQPRSLQVPPHPLTRAGPIRGASLVRSSNPRVNSSSAQRHDGQTTGFMYPRHDALRG